MRIVAITAFRFPFIILLLLLPLASSFPPIPQARRTRRTISTGTTSTTVATAVTPQLCTTRISTVNTCCTTTTRTTRWRTSPPPPTARTSKMPSRADVFSSACTSSSSLFAESVSTRSTTTTTSTTKGELLLLEKVTIVGFGSLLSERSAKSTFPHLQNFRLGKVNDYQRVFGHPASIFFERGIANNKTKEMSSLAAEYCPGSSFICSVFEVSNENGEFMVLDTDTDTDTDTDGMPIDTKQDDDFAPSDVDDNDNPAGSSSSNQKANAYSNTNAAQFDIKPNGLGEWEEMHGNYILRPPAMDQEPRALIHFLGGAIVGAAPDISYRYMLERLAQKGFLIVATPFTLSFDYISTCDDIIGRFERIAPTLARQFGPVPVVGVGHSCGALLQLLITTLFPDTPRAANALISYNNKEVKDAIPLFDELFAPLFVSLATNETNPLNELIGGASDGAIFPPNSVELMNIGIQLSRKAVRGELPSDDLLTDIAKRTTPKPLASILPQDIVVPSILRDSFRNLLDPVKDAKVYAGIIPLLDQSLDVLEQIPSLIEEVAEGARDFNPNPASVKAAARRSYRARRTLVIQYDNDPLDESEEVESLLREAETVMRSKRPDVDVDVQRTVLKGGHATPCLAPPLDLASKAEDILGEDTAKDKLLYIGADATVDELVRWLEEGNL